MKSIRILALGILLASTLAAAAVLAQQAIVPASPGRDIFYAGPYSSAHSPSAQLAQQYVKATKEEDKKDIRKKLVDALNLQFDQHIQHQQKELEDLEKQIADLKAVLKKRLDAKTTIVERRIDQLLQEADGLGWTSPGTPRPVYAPMWSGSPPEKVTRPR
jgi:uncharacterized protein YlxW (UPF0749 family)